MNDTGPYQLPPAEPAPTGARPRGRPPTGRFQPKSEPRRAEPAAAEEPVVATGERLQRNRKRTEDKFYFPRKLIPAGYDYEWKAVTCKGMSLADHQSNLRDNHWSPVPQDRHPKYLVEKDGMLLMERPKYLTDEARAEDLQIALDRVQGIKGAIGGTPTGSMPRKGGSLQTSYDMPIPDGGGDTTEQR